MNQETTKIILLVSPIVIGGIFAAINSDGVNNTTEKAEAWTRKRQLKTSVSSGNFTKFIINPILWIIVTFCDWTDGFTHRGIKSGTRVAATLYLIAAWLFILYIAFMAALVIAIVIGILYVIFKVLLSSSDNTTTTNYEYEKPKKDIPNMVGLKGNKIYSGTNWFNEELEGRVDKEGNVYSGTNWINEEKIGRIDKDGNIYKGSNWLNEEKSGRIDKDGNIHEGRNWLNEEKVGRIDKDGNIQKGTNWFNEEKTGRTGE